MSFFRLNGERETLRSFRKGRRRIIGIARARFSRSRPYVSAFSFRLYGGVVVSVPRILSLSLELEAMVSRPPTQKEEREDSICVL